MACVYNLSREDRVSSSVTGVANAGEVFEDEDIPIMYRAIRQVNKPCVAFKILGATRRCGSREQLEHAYREAFENIKPTDAVAVGMFPKYSDQVKENCEIVKSVLERI
jgi:hypothetical protein